MSSFIPDELIEEIRINNDIVDVVSEYVKLEKKGKDYLGLCPFHKEKTPSFSVVPGKQIFYCFGCLKGGNVFNFVSAIENISYIDAVRHLAERARIQLPEGESEGERQKARLRNEIIKANTEAARYFYTTLSKAESEPARQYIKKRGISRQIIRSFGMGYSTEKWDDLFKHLKSKGFSQEAIAGSGLVIPGKNGGCYDRFRGRLMFPIFDVRGKVIAFGGRVLDSSNPKYMNSPETPVYSKGNTLYALNIAKNSGQKSVVIVEGYMDVISLHQCGIINAVASLGTALTSSQGRLLKKYFEEVIISYDADTAGQSATMRGLDLLSDMGCSVKVLVIPDGKDPDEYVKKHGADDFRNLMAKSISLLEYKVRALKRQINTDTTEGKVSFLKKMAELLSKIDNRVEREMYVNKLAREYSITTDSLLTEIYRFERPKTSYRQSSHTVQPAVVQRQQVAAESPAEKHFQLERMLLTLLCIDNSIYRHVEQKIKPEDFEDETNARLASVIYRRIDEKKGIVPAELLSLLDESDAGSFTGLIQQQSSYEDTSKAAADLMRNIEMYKLDRRQQEIFELLGSKGNSIERNVEKLKLELNSIILRKKELQTNS